MSELVSWKNSVDGFEVEFEAISPVDFSGVKDERQLEILEGLQNVNEQIRVNQDLINKLNADIDRLTNSADGLDYTIAVASGIIAGLIDSFFVGEFSIDNANDWGDKRVNNFVISVAQKQGYKGDDLQGAILFMEKKYGAPSDSVTSMFGGGKQHHLRDFAHHPTPVGLFFSMLTQFTSKAYGTDTAGMFIVVDVVNKSLIGDDLPKKILYGVVFWLFHMVSDMAGSNATAGAGTGLPGPLVSLVKELSVLPIFKNASINGTELSVWVSKLFNGTLLSKRDENGKILEAVKFDLRTEIGVAHEIGKQAIPVIINECIVRGFYFIRRFVMEIKANEIKRIGDLGKIDWKKTLPFKNRTIVRMLTISTGTFTAIDLADAAIRSAAKSGGFGPAFAANFVLHVNFVGVGRFAVAVGTDVGMGIKRSRLRNERIELLNEQLYLSNAKIFYKQAGMWIEAENAGKTIADAYEMMDKTAQCFVESMNDIRDNMKKIGSYAPQIEEHNSGLISDINDIINWG